jgi:hypothetical protein
LTAKSTNSLFGDHCFKNIAPHQHGAKSDVLNFAETVVGRPGAADDPFVTGEYRLLNRQTVGNSLFDLVDMQNASAANCSDQRLVCVQQTGAQIGRKCHVIIYAE